MSNWGEPDIPKKTYTVLFAEDIPHYGSAEIDARDDEDAIRVAKAFDTGDLHYEGSWDASVCKRIVSIEDSEGRTVDSDIPLDSYRLFNADALPPAKADASLISRPPDILDALLNIKRLAGKSGDAEADPFALLDLVSIEVRAALNSLTPHEKE